MLEISASSLNALEQSSWPGFVRSLTQELAETYPHFLPRFPENVQLKIVQNMLGRAALWGIDRQNSLYCYCGFMIEIAPNFDEEPEIAGGMRNLGGTINQRLFDLPDLISEEAWDRAEAQCSNLPLFIGPDLVGGSVEQQTIAAICLALHDRPEGERPLETMAAAQSVAKQLGLGDELDSSLVIAACHSLFGLGFEQLPWMRGLLSDRHGPRACIEAMRFRLALEFGRFV